MRALLPLVNIANFSLNVIGATIALSALIPIHTVAKISRRRQIRRTWKFLSAVILTCVGLHMTSTFYSINAPLEMTDLFATGVNLLGPIFICGVSHLSLMTAKDLLRIEALEAAAKTDPLTGALNRSGFSDAIGSHQTSIGVIMTDLDHFKRINDRLGHQAGDYVLRCFVERTKKILPKSGYLARFGGEEFVIALPDTSLEATVLLAERLRISASRHPIDWPIESISITVSVGVALAASGQDISPAIEKADKVLYEAKNRGRNQVCVA
jgi:diguanylate cyclase (GGDEF)-like protein